jgi:peptidoglycan/LPS O-acetylase OafA/YrhL
MAPWPSTSFILSGFVLTHQIVSSDTSMFAFSVRRIARMWPLHIATMLAALALIPQQRNDLIVFANATLLQNSGIIRSGNTLNWPAWSISAELIVGVFIFYPIAVRRMAPIAAMLALAALIVLLEFGGSIAGMTGQPYGPISIGLVRCMFGVLLGYLTYEAYLRFKDRMSRAGRLVSVLLQAACLAGMVAIFAYRCGNGLQMTAVLLASIAIFLLTTSETPIVSSLSHRTVSWLGNLSFGIYMVHAPMLLVAWKIGFLPHHTILEREILAGHGAAYLPRLAIFFATVLAVAVGSYALIEMPGKRLILRATLGNRITPAPGVSAVRRSRSEESVG